MASDVLFEPLVYRSLTLGNRLWRSNIAALGCYDESRLVSREAMVDQIFSVFSTPPFGGAEAHA